MLLVSSSATHAIVIHDHHGHDTHGHSMTLHDLDSLRENSEHQHEDHDHHGSPVDPTEHEGTPINPTEHGRTPILPAEHHGIPVLHPENEGTPILIVLDIPEALPRTRTVSLRIMGGVSGGVAVAIGPVLRTLAVIGGVAANGLPAVEGQRTLAHIPRARTLIAGILLTNHALLL